MADHGVNATFSHISAIGSSATLASNYVWVVEPNFNHSDVNGTNGEGVLIQDYVDGTFTNG